MSTTFRNVALIGATGNLGLSILKALTDAGFNVTAIQRSGSTNKVPEPTKAIQVDLSSTDELISAFTGQDVVVSAAPNPRLSSEKIWMDAAATAGVKRIVPSEFSTNLESPLSQQLAIVKDKLEVRRYLQQLAADGKIQWTSVNGGPFFVAPLWIGGFIGPNASNKTAMYHDGGNNIVCTSTLQRIAEGVARSLKPEYAAATQNQPVYVYSAPMSERKMTALVAKATGIQPSDFAETQLSIADVTNSANEALAKGDKSKIMSLYIPFCFGEGYGGDFRDLSWNQKLGLQEMSDQETEQLVKSWL